MDNLLFASEIVSVVLTGGSYRTPTGFVDFSQVNEAIDKMDGDTGACNDMRYGDLKDRAAYLVAEEYGNTIAHHNGWTFINDMMEEAA